MLQVQKRGIVKDGCLVPFYNYVLEVFNVTGWVSVGIGPIRKRIEIKEAKEIKRDLLRPSQFVLGRKEKFGEISLEVTESDSRMATVIFSDENGDEGVCILDKTKEYVDIIKINAKGKYMGYEVEFEAIRV